MVVLSYQCFDFCHFLLDELPELALDLLILLIHVGAKFGDRSLELSHLQDGFILLVQQRAGDAVPLRLVFLVVDLGVSEHVQVLRSSGLALPLE